MLLKQVNYIYELTPLGALALKPRCMASSPALTILEIDPSGDPIQFALFLNRQMEEQ